MGLTLVYFMTLANWITAVVLDGATLIPLWFWVAGWRRLRRTRRVQRGRPGVWDEWLDGSIGP